MTPVVSLVGYTNAGKSTLFNLLTKELVNTSSQLFSTLDPVIRRVTFSDGLYFFLSDTVGFIKKLPVELITAFKATLEELKEADCISYFETRAPFHVNIWPDQGVPKAHVRKKFEFMYSGLKTERAKKIAEPLFKKAIDLLESRFEPKS